MLKKYWLAVPIAVIMWLFALSAFYDLTELLIHYAKFSVLGVIGAIFANSTGAGGGVVFIPAFNSLNFSEMQAVHTSFAIQCFGMTAGSIAWLRFKQREQNEKSDWYLLPKLLLFTVPAAIVGLALVIWAGLPASGSLHTVFSVFSIVLAIALFATLAIRQNGKAANLQFADFIVLMAISLLGGVVTAWLSVGVGEFIAVYLILRRVQVRIAVACAVIVSAISVWFAALSLLLLELFAAYWQVVVFAGPGAILGGILARYLATWISPVVLKRFFAGWVLLVGILGVME